MNDTKNYFHAVPNMSSLFQIDGAEYAVDALTSDGKTLLVRLQFTQLKIQEFLNQQAVLTNSKNAYISDLGAEIVKGKSGIDLSTLISED
ncbi:MAG: hypothetical protein ACKVLN_01785 [Rhodobacterales bacterium]